MIAANVPLFPTIYVSNPLLAKLSAWYIIRGLRPTSPRTTIATERSNGLARVFRKANAPARHRSSPRTIEEVRVFILMSQAWEMRLDDNDTKVAGGSKRHVRRASKNLRSSRRFPNIDSVGTAVALSSAFGTYNVNAIPYARTTTNTGMESDIRS